MCMHTHTHKYVHTPDVHTSACTKNFSDYCMEIKLINFGIIKKKVPMMIFAV